jgi:hypothetical protein
MNKSPSEIILNRSKAYNESNPKDIHDSYLEESDFRALFPTLEDYKSQFFDLTAVYGSIKTEIIRERIKNNLAEVIYIDRVISNEGEITFYCKGYLALTKSGWKIKKEKKEIVE